MSHQPERKEKDCLNCGTTVVGRYCHFCGQENIVTKENFWSLTKHFIFDILHFDGKFFHTMKYLFTRPGLAPRQYCEGRRASHLHPIRMYLFTSAVFFLVFFSIDNSIMVNPGVKEDLTAADRAELLRDYRARLQKNPADTIVPNIIARLKDTTHPITGGELLNMDSRPVFTVSANVGSKKQYDSIQNTLPPADRDSWFRQRVVSKIFQFNEKYKGRITEGSNLFWQAVLHKLPYLLFLSLPFFALILKLLYARRKNFYYSDHSVFTLYHYILSFILLLLMIIVGQVRRWTGFDGLSWMALALGMLWAVYLLLELKHFYRQGWGRTVIKFVLLNFLGIFVLLSLFAGFFVFSLMEL